MRCYRAVLFDWRGTLVEIPALERVVAQALAAVRRPAAPEAVDAIVARLRTAQSDPGYVEAERRIDSSPEIHQPVTMRLFERAGIDSELADELYRVEWELENRPLYPDAVDVLSRARRLGVKIAVVSDVHFDIRADCAAQGIAPFIDAYVLSVEQGFQKPDARMFQLALDALAVEADEALMVGDWPPTDGGAVAVGITTLILAPQAKLAPRGLNIVLRLLGRSDTS